MPIPKRRKKTTKPLIIEESNLSEIKTMTIETLPENENMGIPKNHSDLLNEGLLEGEELPSIDEKYLLIPFEELFDAFCRAEISLEQFKSIQLERENRLKKRKKYSSNYQKRFNPSLDTLLPEGLKNDPLYAFKMLVATIKKGIHQFNLNELEGDDIYFVDLRDFLVSVAKFKGYIGRNETYCNKEFIETWESLLKEDN